LHARSGTIRILNLQQINVGHNGQHRRIWSAVGLLLFAVASAHPAWAAGPKRVLLLYHSFAIILIHAKEIRAQLDRQSKDSFEIYDAPLLPPSDENVEDRYAEYLHARFRDQRLDLAIAIGADAMNLFRRYRHQVFPSTPMVALLDQRRIPLANLAANEAVRRWLGEVVEKRTHSQGHIT
jgi:hypothetical protein